MEVTVKRMEEDNVIDEGELRLPSSCSYKPIKKALSIPKRLGIGKRERDKCYHLVKELLLTERTYLNDLDILVGVSAVRCTAMQAKALLRDRWNEIELCFQSLRQFVLNQDECRTLHAFLETNMWSMLDALRSGHLSLLAEMESRLARWEQNSHEATRMRASYRHIFSEYCKAYHSWTVKKRHLNDSNVVVASADISRRGREKCQPPADDCGVIVPPRHRKSR
ncbi:hypothetical protein Ciccas_005593 [Cichlidogyrus casuarinus]|uniref:DH domain-containing protein n=1 Tax=Cichlidogyrus casuarinus TaxID=1844966 RepID=A0ABD2Q968_9PLAT